MKFLRKILAGIQGSFDITGYQAYKGVNMLFTVNCTDEDLKKKIRENNLSTAERNFIISSVSEYFETQCQSDENLFNYGVANIIIDYMEGNMKLPESLINKEVFNKTMQKKQKTNEIIFNKNKFKAMPLAEKVQIITDFAEFFSYVYGDDFMDKNYDIKNLIQLQGEEQVLEDEEDELQTASFQGNRILAKIAGKNVTADAIDEAVMAFKTEYEKVYYAVNTFAQNCQSNYVPKMNQNPSENFDFINTKLKEVLDNLQDIMDQFSEDFFD